MDNTSKEINTTHHGILEQNCRHSWPRWTCLFANISGLCSTALWFIVLFPQIWKNFRRKSVRGLSILWATANFTASLINLFFVFLYAKIPLYGQISSVYSPVLEFILLLQFWIYGHNRVVEKVAYSIGCLVLWGTVIAVELIFHLENFVEYAAIFLWSVETFPQIILNMRLHTACGQAVGSAFIAMVGKTTDFIATNSLEMPIQYVIMRYFSTSVAYVNGLQVAWYYGKDIDGKGQIQVTSDGDSHSKFEGHDNLAYHSSIQSVNGSEKQSAGSLSQQGQTMSRLTLVIKWLCIVVLCVFLVICLIWFSWNVESYFGLFAPFSIICILGVAKLYILKCYSGQYSIQD